MQATEQIDLLIVQYCWEHFSVELNILISTHTSHHPPQ